MAAASITTEILRPVLTGMRIRGMATPEISISLCDCFQDDQRSYVYHSFPNRQQVEPVKNP